MEDHSKSTTFLHTKDHNVYIFLQNYLTVARPHLIAFFLTRVEKEPVQSQQFLVKRDCDFETDLKNSFIIATEILKNLPKANKQFFVIPRQVSLVSFHPRCILFSPANCSILFSFSCLSVDNISFNFVLIVCLFRLF